MEGGNKREGHDEDVLGSIVNTETKISDALTRKDEIEGKLDAAKLQYNSALKKFNNGGKTPGLWIEVGNEEMARDNLKMEKDEEKRVIKELQAQLKKLRSDHDKNTGEITSGSIKKAQDELDAHDEFLRTMGAELEAAQTNFNTTYDGYNEEKNPELREQYEKDSNIISRLEIKHENAQEKWEELQGQLGQLQERTPTVVEPIEEPKETKGKKAERKVIDLDSEPEDLDEEDGGRILWYPGKQPNGSELIHPDNQLKQVAYRKGRGLSVITSRGPKNSIMYRLDRDVSLGSGVPNVTTKKYGEILGANGKRRYGRENNPQIQGVAWYTYGFANPVEILRPPEPLPDNKEAADAEHRRRRIDNINNRKPFIDALVYIRWTIDGKFVRSWETRSVCRSLWRKTADQGIYEAAIDQEEKYNDWFNGLRPGNSKSPSPLNGQQDNESRRTATQSPERSSPTRFIKEEVIEENSSDTLPDIPGVNQKPKTAFEKFRRHGVKRNSLTALTPLT